MSKMHDIKYIYDESTDIELILCNQSTLSYPLHNHVSIFTIGMVLDGSLFLSTNKASNFYTKNQIFAIHPYVPHSIRTETNYTLLTLCINKDIIYTYNINELKKMIINIFKKVAVPQISYEQITKILSYLDDFYNSISLNKSNFINKLENQIKLFPENKISIEEMAQSAYISKYHFIRCFKQEIGLTPHQFQIQNRIRKAQRLLPYVDSITKVALTTGFCDQSHFIKHFERIVGLTPTAYKTSYNLLNSNSTN